MVYMGKATGFMEYERKDQKNRCFKTADKAFSGITPLAVQREEQELQGQDAWGAGSPSASRDK